jgi:hypothetical protein
VLIIHFYRQISDIINVFLVITQKPAILPYVLFLVTVAMLIGAWHHRTQVVVLYIALFCF